MSIDFTKDLNDQQYMAVTSNAKHLRIIAGAGTGKTRVLTYRLAHLISVRKILPSKIVAITFTNKVAKEMKERVGKLIMDEQDIYGSPFISTFHGFCYRFLVREMSHIEGFTTKFGIADEETQNSIFKTLAENLGYKLKSPYMSSLVSTIRDLKTRGIFADEVSNHDLPMGAQFNYQALSSTYKAYQNTLKRSNLLDFDDLLMFTLKILKENMNVRIQWQKKYNVYLIDEFQDTNQVQYDLVKLLMGPDSQLAVVGDPDQTIYTWRGADNNLVRFQLEKDYDDLETITLDENYRSTQSILDKANKLIKYNHNRIDKELVASSKVVGDRVELLRSSSQENEARQIASMIYTLNKRGRPLSDFAIIYRSNYLSRAIEQALSQSGIHYRLYGALKFYERAEIKDALAYLRLLINPEDSYSFARILKAPAKGIGDRAIEEISSLCTKYQTNPLYVLRDHIDEIKLTKPTVSKMKQFFEAYEKCLNSLEKNDDIDKIQEIVKTYFSEVGFLDYVISLDRKREEKEDTTSTSKFDNVMELISSIDQFMNSAGFDDELEPTLEDFLILVAIQSAQDEIEDDNGTVLVMTAHVSKGLEFPYVFITGLCQGVFPNSRALLESGMKAMEEERRLLYVAITRAKEHLVLSYFQGYNYMTQSENFPSPFLKELDLVSNANRPTINQRPKDGESEYTRIQKILEKRMEVQDELSGGRRGIIKQESVKDTYVVGDKLAHSSYGIGVVIKIDGLKLTVQFGDGSVRTLVNGFKAFKKIYDK